MGSGVQARRRRRRRGRRWRRVRRALLTRPLPTVRGGPGRVAPPGRRQQLLVLPHLAPAARGHELGEHLAAHARHPLQPTGCCVAGRRSSFRAIVAVAGGGRSGGRSRGRRSRSRAVALLSTPSPRRGRVGWRVGAGLGGTFAAVRLAWTNEYDRKQADPADVERHKTGAMERAEGGRGTSKREHVIAAYGGKVSRGARRQHTLEKNVKEKKKTVEARVACWWMGTSKAPEAARRTEGRAMQLANGGRTVKPRHRPNSYVQLPSCLAAQEPNGTEPAGQTTATKGKRNEGARRSQSAATITNTAAFAPT